MTMLQRLRNWRRRRRVRKHALRWVAESQAALDRVGTELAAIHAEIERERRRRTGADDDA